MRIANLVLICLLVACSAAAIGQDRFGSSAAVQAAKVPQPLASGVFSDNRSASIGNPRNYARQSASTIPRVASLEGIHQTYVVTTNADTGAGSMRRAIHDANLNPGLDFITFAITNGQPTIQLKTAFEVITDPVVIDASTQPGYSDHPIVELDGTLLVNQTFDNGLEIDVAGCTVRGLAINRFAAGIVIDASGGDILESNFLGTDPTGTTAEPNFLYGVVTFGPNNRIGAWSSPYGNVISGNGINVEIDGFSAHRYGGDRIVGNIIGLNVSGTSLPFGITPQTNQVGVFLDEVSQDTVGGLEPGARNIISGNTNGVYIGNTADASGNLVEGNFIGLDINGTQAFANTTSGVAVWNGKNNTIGGAVQAARNIISGNGLEGLRLRAGATGNLVQGNYIGTDPTGAYAIPNGDGILVKFAVGNTIGGTAAGMGNLIAGNTSNGILIDSMSTNITVQGNLIGVTSQPGTLTKLANGASGISVTRSPRNLIGGALAGAGNTIGGNAMDGIVLTGDSSVANAVEGNAIGTDGTGVQKLPNGEHGVKVDASRNTVGGALDVLRNYIRYNVQDGIFLTSGTGNLISHNSIASNGLLGIDISPPGPNPNDPLDADLGPNEAQNFPVVDSVRGGLSSTVIKGHLSSDVSTQYTIDFYRNTKASPTGYGEGDTFIGSTQVTTDVIGNATFAVTLPIALGSSKVVTATATDGAGNTSEFSRASSPITITHPLAGEVYITGEIDTVQWVLGDSIGQVGVEYSIDNGKTFALIPGGVPGSTGQKLWVPTKGILSTHCLIHVFDVTNSTVGDTSGLFKIKGWELTRDSSGEFVRYEVQRDGWSFANTPDDVWPQSYWSTINYQTGKDVYTNLPFQEDIQVLGRSWFFPDWQTWENTFGTKQCFLDLKTGTYKLSAVAAWLAHAQSWGGSCFGFAISSFVAFDNPPLIEQNFPGIGPFIQLHDLGDPTKAFSRQAINQLWVTQLGKEHMDYAVPKFQTTTPRMTLDELKNMLKSSTRADLTLSMQTMSDVRSGAHAVCPYKIERDSNLPNILYIFVYDNNKPDDAFQFVQVDSAADEWTYSGLHDWNGNIGLYLREPAVEFMTTPTMGSKPQKAVAGPAATMDVFVANDASVKITAGEDSIGYAGAGTFNSIPGAVPIVLATGGTSAPIGYRVPTGNTYGVAITNPQDSIRHFSTFTDSTIFSYWRSNVKAGETDNLRFGPGFDVANRDAAVKVPQIQSIIVQSDNERFVGLQNVTLGVNDSVHLDVVNRQALKVTNAGDSLRYDLRIQHASGADNTTFKHSHLVVPPHSAAQIVPAWDQLPSSPVRIYIDHGNTGKFDDSLLLANEFPRWGSDSSFNTPICTAPGWQTSPVITADGYGGSIIVWQDQRKGNNIYYTDFDLYVQKINPLGWPQWTGNGVQISSGPANDLNPRIVSDKAGGAIVVWWTAGNASGVYEIRAQRIDSTGTLRWGSNGLVIDTYRQNLTEFYSVISDEMGGVIIASVNWPSAPASVFAQRIDPSGALLWGTHGVALAPVGANAQSAVIAAPDSMGGGFFGWSDNRYGGTDSAGALFVQHLDASGNLLWGTSGKKMSNHSFRDLMIIPVASGSAIYGWSRSPGGTGLTNNQIRAQKITGDGVQLWTTNGLTVTSNTLHDQTHTDLCTDGKGGALFTWEEARTGTLDVYVQHVDSSGGGMWFPTGALIEKGTDPYYRLPEIVDDGRGGAIVVWQDDRNVNTDPNNSDIYAQGLNADGTLEFGAGGVVVTTAPHWQNLTIYFKRSIAMTEPTRSAVVVWEDGRDSSSAGDPGQIYAARVTLPQSVVTGIGPTGSAVAAQYRLDQNYPNPFNPSTTIRYAIPRWSHVILTVYNILGQKISVLVDDTKAPGEHSVKFNATGLATGVYFYRLQADTYVETKKLLLLR